MSSCLIPAKRVWRGVSARLGLRRTTTGLGRLRKEVRTCEYGDVHVMWEMLSKTPSSRSSTGRDRRRATDGKGAVAWRGRAGRKGNAWSRLASYCCAL